MNESQYTTVQNSRSPALQDDLILSVIEQLKTQVVNCTKINKDNKNVNEILTAELKRYKNQERILKEQNNVENASVKELNNIVFKRNQSAQTVHMLTKPQFFYDHSTRQALEETLMLAEESRSKMLQKQNEPIMSKMKVNTKLVDYAALNQLLKDFKTRFIPQADLSVEQAFWSRYSVQPEKPNLFISIAIVEVPKELPKVSMVNSSLKKLKFHLASFDMVVKERTTATAITEGMWGFEHTKACFRDDIIPFLKGLKELFNSFDQFLIDELTEDKMKKVLKDNERLLEQAISVNIVNIVVHDHVNSADKTVKVCEPCVPIETELQKDFVPKECYDTLFKKFNTIEKHYVAPLAPKLHNNRTAHTDYLRHTQEETATLKEIVKSERLVNPFNTSLNYTLPLKEPIPIESNTDKPVVTLVYSRKSKAAKKKVQVSKLKINKSLVANKMKPKNSWGSTSSNVSSSLIEC
nr:hypothetical protein [Tanacetum cinerariifolium]